MTSQLAPLMVSILLTAAPDAGPPEEEPFGAPVDGVQLGLKVAPQSGDTPSGLLLHVALRNQAEEVRKISIRTCLRMTWDYSLRIHARLPDGTVHRFPPRPVVDLMVMHPHPPLRLRSGELLRSSVSQTGVAWHDSPGTRRVWRALVAAEFVELWVKLGPDSEGFQLSSNRVWHRFHTL
jgi:hypothetical protein